MQSKKVVYFFVNEFGLTGSETLLFGFIKDLSLDSQFSIHVVTKNLQGLLISSLPQNVTIHHFSISFSFWDKLKFNLRFNVIEEKLNKIFKLEQPDIIYLNTLNNAFLLSYLKNYSARKLVHIHELLMGLNSMKPIDFQNMLKLADELVACSELVSNLYQGIFAKGITQINSIQQYSDNENLLDPIKTSNTKIKLVCAGTICYFKGFDYFLEIAKVLDPTKYELHWYGKFDDSAFSAWAKLVLNLPEYSHVSISHFNSQKQYLKALSQNDVFVFTSREESMGLVLMDAMRCGLPILCMERKGSSLILDKEVDEFFNIEDISNLDKLIASALNIPSDQLRRQSKFEYAVEFIKFKSLLERV